MLILICIGLMLKEAQAEKPGVALDETIEPERPLQLEYG